MLSVGVGTVFGSQSLSRGVLGILASVAESQTEGSVDKSLMPQECLWLAGLDSTGATGKLASELL